MIVDKIAATEVFCGEVELIWITDNRRVFLRVLSMSCSFTSYISKVREILRLSAERLQGKLKGTGINSSTGFTCTHCRLSGWYIIYLHLPVCFPEKTLHMKFIFL